MSAFKALLRQHQSSDGAPLPVVGPASARRVVTLPPSAFADTWVNRPREPAKIGLRLIAEDTYASAQASAAKWAWEAHPDERDRVLWVDSYNSALMREVLAVAMCKAENVELPWFEDVPNHAIRAALTDMTVRRLWEELELLRVETSPLMHEADDAEIAELAIMLNEAPLDGAGADSTRRIRRLVSHLRAEMI